MLMENSLRQTPFLSVWAAINQYQLPVLLGGPLPYEEISSNDDYFDRLQSVIMVTCIISHV